MHFLKLNLRSVLASNDLTAIVKKLESRVAALELSGGGSAAPPAASKPAESKPAADSDDDDLFGSDVGSNGYHLRGF